MHCPSTYFYFRVRTSQISGCVTPGMEGTFENNWGKLKIVSLLETHFHSRRRGQLVFGSHTDDNDDRTRRMNDEDLTPSHDLGTPSWDIRSVWHMKQNLTNIFLTHDLSLFFQALTHGNGWFFVVWWWNLSKHLIDRWKSLRTFGIRESIAQRRNYLLNLS